MAVGARALVTLADVKTYVKITDTTQDTILEMLIDGISDVFNRYLGRTIVKTTYTAAYFDGNGEADFLLPNYPITAVTSIVEDGATLTEGITGDYVWYADEGRLHKNGAVWVKGPKTILITYTAGYVAIDALPANLTLPLDLKLAALMQTATEWKRHQQATWGETSRTFKDGTITRGEGPLLPQVKAILDRYLDYRP